MQLPKGQILIDKYLCALCLETGRRPVRCCYDLRAICVRFCVLIV